MEKMTMRIGVVLPKGMNENELSKIRKIYNIGMISINNKYIQNQLEIGEQFFQFTQHGIDSQSGIGAYELYTKDLKSIYEYNEEIYEGEKKSLLDFIKKSREEYERDAKRIILIIKEMLFKYNIDKLGIFYFDGYTTSDKVKVDISEKRYVNINYVDIKYIMQIEQNVIVYFSK